MFKLFQYVVFILSTTFFYVGFIYNLPTKTINTSHPEIRFGDIEKLEYIIEPQFYKNATKLNVDLYIKLKNKPNPQNILYLHLPDKFGSAKKLYLDIKSLKIVGAEATMVSTNEPYTKIIKNILNNNVHFNYTVVCSVKNLKNMRGQNDYYRPILTKNYLHLIGRNFIIFPCWKYENKNDYYTPEEKINITLQWKSIPSDWTITNSHGIDCKKQNLFISINNLVQSIYVAGDFRIKKFVYKNNPVFIAIRGTFHFQDEEFVELAKTVITTQREFWNDYNFPYFLITVLPLGKNWAVGGVSLLNSFALFLGEKKELKSIDTIYSINHECFHTWNKEEMTNYLLPWFSEGFTDYYAYNLALHAKLITFEQYIKAYNNVLYHFYTSPHDRSLKHIIQNNEFEKIHYYYGGHLLAYHWNAKIREETGGKFSLDNVMFDIFKELTYNKPSLPAPLKSQKKKKPQLIHKKNICPKLINKIMKNYLKDGVEEDIKRYIDNGEIIIPNDHLFWPYCKLHWIKVKKGNEEFDVPQYVLNNKIILFMKQAISSISNSVKKGLRYFTQK